ncbi:MAG: helix-turn-helix domain-containing protein [Actinomycetota bacterium]
MLPMSTTENSNRLQDEMSRQQLSYRDLAFRTDLSPAFLCRVANGRRKPSKINAERIARALRVSPYRLWRQD